MDYITRNRWVVLLLTLTGLLIWGAARASAQDAQPTPSDNDVNRVANQMYCPVCENIPLDVCPTQACSEWRELIRLKLSEGWTDQQIKDYFVVQYGDRVLAEPPPRGLNWLVYILPAVFFLGGVVAVWRILANMQARKLAADRAVMAGALEPGAADEPEGAVAANDRYLRELEEQLKKRP